MIAKNFSNTLLEQQFNFILVCRPESHPTLYEHIDRTFAEMAVVHEGWIAEMLHAISPEDKGQLINLLSHMKQHLNTSDDKKD